MERAKSKYRALRDEILNSSVPSPGKLICLCLVEHYPNISPGTALLVKRTGYSRTTILKTLGELEEWGVLAIQRVKWKPSIYTFTGDWSVPEKRSGKRTSAGGRLVNEATGLVWEVNPGLVREVNPKQLTPKQTKQAANVFVEFASPTSTLPSGPAPMVEQAGTPNEQELVTVESLPGTLTTPQSMPALLHCEVPEPVSSEYEPLGGTSNETASQRAFRSKSQGTDSKQRPTRKARPEAKSRRKLKTGFPADWEPAPSDAITKLERGLDVARQRSKFRDHHLAKGSLMADWDAAYRTWLGNAHDWGQARASGGPRPSTRSLQQNHGRDGYEGRAFA